MLKFSKNILRKVSFDPSLFKKELAKSAKWLNKQEIVNLKVWALTYFAHYKQNIIEVFDNLS
jgi:hypothetical protein|tara:strand:- start:1921 stop:2106 length:186 start_codon:yes stop_codon:yes gene_type:complete